MTKVCYKWGVSDFKWKDGDWLWSECELVREICAKWGEEDIWWKNENIWWSKCRDFIPPEPPKPPITSISTHPPGVDATVLIQPWLIEPWNPYKNEEDRKKRKRLIKLICKCQGYIYEEEKEAIETDISVDDIRMVVNKMAGINLDIKLNE